MLPSSQIPLKLRSTAVQKHSGLQIKNDFMETIAFDLALDSDEW